MDITKMLHAVIDLELSVDDSQELMIGPKVRQQTIFINLDNELSKMADASGWFKVLTTPPSNSAMVLNHYCRALELTLLYSAKRQWTHLVVLDEATMQRITTAEPATKLAELNKEFLAIKHFLAGGYYNNRQDDFRHAWHLLLKMGLVNFNLSPEQIVSKYQSLIDQQRLQWGAQ